MPTLTALRRSRKGLHARFTSLAQSDQPDLSLCAELAAEIDRLDIEIEQAQDAITVGVFREHQPSLISPCELGDPCEICRAHAGRKKLRTTCPRARPNEPAFRIPINAAKSLVRDGLADFINRNKSIRLTFSRLAHFRDRSAKIDERFLVAYAAGERWARNIFRHSWDGRACLPAHSLRS